MQSPLIGFACLNFQMLSEIYSMSFGMCMCVSAKRIWYHNRMMKLQFYIHMQWMNELHALKRGKSKLLERYVTNSECITNQIGVECVYSTYKVLNKKAVVSYRCAVQISKQTHIIWHTYKSHIF